MTFFFHFSQIAGSDKVGPISWEGNGLRLCMGVGPSIYFANVKQDHKWGYMDNGVLVIGYQKQDRVEFSLIYWDMQNDSKIIKFVKNLCEIRACGEYCCIVTHIDDGGYDYWQIDLCNSIGSPLDTKYINIEPNCVTMTKTHIVVCSHDHIYIW